MPVINATDATLDQVVADATASGKPVLIDFWATWCGPCRQVAPVMEQIASEHPEFTVVKVDIDQAPQATLNRKVMGVPTLVVLGTDGQPVSQFTGPAPKPTLVDALRRAA